MRTPSIPSGSQIRQTVFTLLLALGLPGDVLPMIDAGSASIRARVARMRAQRVGRRPRLVWPVALLVGMQAGCAGVFGSAPPSLPLGTVGVASGRFAPEVQVEAPTRESAAAWGATHAPAPGGLSGLVVLPFYLAGGALVGAVLAPPASAVEPARVVLARTLTDLDPTGGLRERVLEGARDRARGAVVSLPGWGPTAAGEVADYRPLAADGIETVLEVAVSRLSLEMSGIKSVRLLVSARARLLQVADGLTLKDRTFDYRSRDRVFTAWAESNSAPLRIEVDRASRTLAEEIATKFFGAAGPARRVGPVAGDAVLRGSRPDASTGDAQADMTGTLEKKARKEP